LSVSGGFLRERGKAVKDLQNFWQVRDDEPGHDQVAWHPSVFPVIAPEYLEV
jgi:hypothetical protein